MANNEPILKVTNLSVNFGGQKILENLDLAVNQGEAVAVIGPNGAGKTTLFRALLGWIPYQGEIHWQKEARIGYVPQRLEIETDVPLTVMEFLSLRGSSNFSREKAGEA